MKTRINFIERRVLEGVSIEKVFRQIAANLSKDKFEFWFEKMPFLNDTAGTLKNLIFFRKTKADIYHITGQVHYIGILLPKEKTVLTIHDAGILHIRSGLRRYVLKKLFFDLPLARLKYITAVSEATKQEVISNTNCRPEKIRVIENPLEELFTTFTGPKNNFNSQCPTILQIGTAPNKNLKNLLRSIEGLDCNLRIIGNLSGEIRNELEEKEIKYQNLIDLNSEEIKKEYENADILTFCSTFEGFGLPIIEAQAMKTPVITSNISPMKEVAGGAAELIDPSDHKSMRNGFLKIINDEQYRKELVSKGEKNVLRFQAKQIAGLYEKLYEEIINKQAFGSNADRPE
jgi:glycosyltransferase involved in cell wall biosynthesis